MEIVVSSVMTGHMHGVYDLHLYDGYLFSVASDGLVAQWDFKTGVLAQHVLTGTAPLYSISILGDKLICGQRNGELIFTDLANKKLIAKTQIGTKELFFAKLLGKNKTTWMAGGGEGKLYYGDTSNWDSVHIVSLSSSNLRCIDINEERNEIAIGASDNLIYILSLSEKRIIDVLEGSENSVFTVKYLDENTMLSGGRDAILRVWKNIKGKWTLSKEIPAHNYTINKIAIHPSKKYFATGSRDKTIKIWDAQDFSLQKVISPEKFPGIHTHSINSIVWDENYLISASDDKKVVTWEISLPL